MNFFCVKFAFDILISVFSVQSRFSHAVLFTTRTELDFSILTALARLIEPSGSLRVWSTVPCSLADSLEKNSLFSGFINPHMIERSPASDGFVRVQFLAQQPSWASLPENIPVAPKAVGSGMIDDCTRLIAADPPQTFNVQLRIFA